MGHFAGKCCRANGCRWWFFWKVFLETCCWVGGSIRRVGLTVETPEMVSWPTHKLNRIFLRVQWEVLLGYVAEQMKTTRPFGASRSCARFSARVVSTCSLVFVAQFAHYPTSATGRYQKQNHWGFSTPRALSFRRRFCFCACLRCSVCPLPDKRKRQRQITKTKPLGLLDTAQALLPASFLFCLLSLPTTRKARPTFGTHAQGRTLWGPGLHFIDFLSISYDFGWHWAQFLWFLFPWRMVWNLRTFQRDSGVNWLLAGP